MGKACMRNIQCGERERNVQICSQMNSGLVVVCPSVRRELNYALHVSKGIEPGGRKGNSDTLVDSLISTRFLKMDRKTLLTQKEVIMVVSLYLASVIPLAVM